MKGLSTTILIVVSAVVILVAALVVLAIFGKGIAPVADMSTARNLCIQKGAAVCSTLKDYPNDWTSANVLVNGNYMSCDTLAAGCTCSPINTPNAKWSCPPPTTPTV
jgi:hypothetical protein